MADDRKPRSSQPKWGEDDEESASEEVEAEDSQESGAVVETPESKIEKLEQELARREEELEEVKDKHLRARADLANLKRRSRQEIDESMKFGISLVFEELLPIIDDFERAFGAAQETDQAEPLREGIELIRRRLHQMMEKRGVVPIEAVGKPFDPQYHEAVAQVFTSDHPEGTVVEELQKGYLMGDQVLRAAKVGVATSPEQEPAEN